MTEDAHNFPREIVYLLATIESLRFDECFVAVLFNCIEQRKYYLNRRLITIFEQNERGTSNAAKILSLLYASKDQLLSGTIIFFLIFFLFIG